MNLPEIEPHFLSVQQNAMLVTSLNEEVATLRRKLSDALAILSIREGQLAGALKKGDAFVHAAMDSSGAPDSAHLTQEDARNIAMRGKTMSVELLMQDIENAAKDGRFKIVKEMERSAGEEAEVELSKKGFSCFFYRPHPTSTDGSLSVSW